ncbi:MAG: FAD-binding oxidoreductase [Pedobacter sp.]|nr:MAG: FAD-binding oxidoreductase [Pedobacter sp.]
MAHNLSYWEKQSFFTADVVIIGSAIVGLNAAITLKQKSAKLNVIVLERGFLPSGASTKNAGFACFGSISELIEQEQICGRNGLHSLISKRWNGLKKLRNLLGDKTIGFENNGGFELFTPQEHSLANVCVSKLSHYNQLIQDIVLQKDVYTEASKSISSFGLKGVNLLLKNNLESQINTGMMMKALIVKANSIGINIYNNCQVNEIIEENNQVFVLTNQGKFSAKKVLITTNAFVNQLLPNTAVLPGRGQVIVTSAIKNLKIKGTFHYDKGYYYFRNIDDRILLGGGRNLDFSTEETIEFGETEIVQNALHQLLKEVILPETNFTIEHKWSGIMAFGKQLTPIIEEAKPNIFCAVRCNGMGIAIGSQTGEEAGEMVFKSL